MQVKKLPCRVNALERKADDVIDLKLQLPANERLQYLAGQYIEFILKDGKRRSYSMASPPHHEGPIELHIRHMPGGTFTDHVFDTMKERDILRFEGPLGTFFLREDSDKPIVLLASGTGFAPIKAIIEHAVFKNLNRPMTLYWGGRRKQDLYMIDLAEQWARTCRTSSSCRCCPNRTRAMPGRAAYGLRSSCGHRRPARPVGVPGVCMRRAGDGRVGAARFHAASSAAGRRVLRGLVHERGGSREPGLSANGPVDTSARPLSRNVSA